MEAGDSIVIVVPLGLYKEKLQSTGAKVRVLKMHRRMGNPFSELKTLLELVKIYRQERPDLCHHFTIKCILYGSLVARILRIRAKVNSFTGLGYLFTTTKLGFFLPRALVLASLRVLLGGAGSKVIVQNEDDRDLLLSRKAVDEKNCVLIPGSGIDMKKFNPSIKKKRNGAELVILMASRLLLDKGIVEYFEAARIIKETKQTSGLRFILAGSIDLGNPSAINQKKLDELIAQGNVEFVGHEEDIKRLLAISDVVVLPSYREGAPRIILEALSCEIPVIGSDVPGIRELIRDGRNGLLVQAKSAKSLSEAIYNLWANPCLREKLSCAARKSIESTYDEKKIVAQTKELYDGLGAA